jgi:phosphomannomutase
MLFSQVFNIYRGREPGRRLGCPAMKDLTKIFKAYDIRGVFPDELDEEVARRIGWAFVRYTKAHQVVVGRDMRSSSPQLAGAFAAGAVAAGAEVIDLGEVSTDALYFASGKMDLPGVMFTASHNPARYNGLKMSREQASPIGSDSGMEEIRLLAVSDEAAGPVDAPDVRSYDILGEYADHCRSFIDTSVLKPLKVAIDAGNGMAGKTVPEVFGTLPVTIVPLFFELDGTFPNHPANPIEAENLVDLQETVRREGCHIGIAFDGDADRMFIVDEMGETVSGSVTTALIAESVLRRNPGSSILYNLICSWAVPEIVTENGGHPIRTRVGHSFIKQIMAETGAVFGGEHSAHYYFRDNFRADSGMIAALIVLEALSRSEVPLSELIQPYDRYYQSGEINSEVTVEYEDWWFNCRASNTEPLLRLNLEARTEELMTIKRDEVLGTIRGGKVGS